MLFYCCSPQLFFAITMNHLPAPLLLLLLLLASHLSISHVSASGYAYTSPPPPYKYQSPPPPPFKPPPPPFTAVVTGNVYCDICKNGQLKKPLQGVTVGVFCWNGKFEESFYGTTDDTSSFKIELKGFDYIGCGGGKACAAKLISASYATHCTQPTDVNGGVKGGALHVKSKSEHGVVLTAGPFAYTPIVNYPKCYPKVPVYGSPPYKYISPPPPHSPPPPPHSPPPPPPCPPPLPKSPPPPY